MRVTEWNIRICFHHVGLSQFRNHQLPRPSQGEVYPSFRVACMDGGVGGKKMQILLFSSYPASYGGLFLRRLNAKDQSIQGQVL